MKREKIDNPANPLKITLESGRKIVVANQRKFGNTFLRKHGCPIVCEWEAIQFLGKYDTTPKKLLAWHRKHTPKDIFATVTVKGVTKGINSICKKLGKAKYYAPSDITTDRLTKMLKAGAFVILIKGKPIHAIALVWDGDTCYKLDKGKAVPVHVADMVKIRSKHHRYGGMCVVTPIKKKPKPTQTKKTKRVTKKVVDDVLAGKYGNGETRKKKLKAAGYDYRKVQDEVNKRLK